jgi:hypothetical protein
VCVAVSELIDFVAFWSSKYPITSVEIPIGFCNNSKLEQWSPPPPRPEQPAVGVGTPPHTRAQQLEVYQALCCCPHCSWRNQRTSGLNFLANLSSQHSYFWHPCLLKHGAVSQELMRLFCKLLSFTQGKRTARLLRIWFGAGLLFGRAGQEGHPCGSVMGIHSCMKNGLESINSFVYGWNFLISVTSPQQASRRSSCDQTGT